MLRRLLRGFKKQNNPFTPSNYSPALKQADPIAPVPQFRVIDLEGKPVSEQHKKLSSTMLNKILQTMIRCEEMDKLLYMSQRQGKISFYMASLGETATTVGAAAGIKEEDLIYPQYREQGSFMWRGYGVEDFISQCVGSWLDTGKGRQMPVHYGSSKHNIVTVSSPLTTQVPQASGAGYGFKLQRLDRIALTYFGQGAASEGDFHSAMNFAVTLGSQTLFACRNNKYAISTSSSEQFKGDGIIGKARGYGMRSIRVDGNDALAVVLATQFAREEIIKHRQPFFVEYMTYRLSDHSTSDNSTLYREDSQRQSWQKLNNPIHRLSKYLDTVGQRTITEAVEEELRKQVKAEVIKYLKKHSEEKLPAIGQLFTDVYSEKPSSLIRQEQSLLQHIERNPQYYDISKYKS